MVEVDLSQVVIPLIAIVVPVLIVFLGKFGKTTEGTLTGSIKIEGLKTNVDNVKEEMSKGFERLEYIVNERYTEMRHEFDKTNNKVNEISIKTDLHEYRLDRLEKERDRSSRNWQGGSGNNNNDRSGDRQQ